MADPERFNVDPDPTFHADADPDSIFFGRDTKNVRSKPSTFFSKIVQKLVMGNFLSNNDLIDTDISLTMGRDDCNAESPKKVNKRIQL